MRTLQTRGSFIAAALVLISGCASRSPVVLTNSARSFEARDIASFSERNTRYEGKEGNAVGVLYSLSFEPSRNNPGYRLIVAFRNLTDRQLRIEPTIALQDADRFVIAPTSFEAMMAIGASLAGTPAPLLPPGQTSAAYYHSGTVRDMNTGRSATYSGYSAPIASPAGAFAGGFANGMAQGAAIAAAQQRQEGRELMRWTNAFWLKRTYDVPPKAIVSGALFFPVASIGALPLRLSVEAAGERFEFLSVARR